LLLLRLRLRLLLDHERLGPGELEVVAVLDGAVDVQEGQVAVGGGSHRRQGGLKLLILIDGGWLFLEVQYCCKYKTIGNFYERYGNIW